MTDIECPYDEELGSIDYEPYPEFDSAEETTGWLRSWTGDKELDGDALRVFGQDGTGGLAACWLVRPGRPLAEQPIVFFGSEGSNGVVAASLPEFLWLLAGGVGPMEAVEYGAELSSRGAAGREWFPLLLLTGTNVETGCRLAISPIRLTTLNGKTQKCDGVTDRQSTEAAMTNDVLDYLCDDENDISPSGLRRSTAALWGRVKPSVDRHNSDRQGAQVEPMFLMLDNHYLPIATPRAPSRVQEIYIPPSTKGKPDALDDIGAEQRAHAAFGDDFLAIRPEKSPGLEAPLAWSLSCLSIKDLDKQRKNAMEKDAVVAFKTKVRSPQLPQPPEEPPC